MNKSKIQSGRPRISVDFATVLRLRDVEKMGWSRMAEAYRKMTCRYVSRDTIKRRYFEAKAEADRKRRYHEELSEVTEIESSVRQSVT